MTTPVTPINDRLFDEVVKAIADNVAAHYGWWGIQMGKNICSPMERPKYVA